MGTFIHRLVHNMAVVGLLCMALQACSTHHSNSSHLEKPIYYIYLAGPEVFLPKPVEAGAAKKKIIKQLNRHYNWPFTLVGLYPMDNEIDNFAPDIATGMKIYYANIKLMDKAHYVAANMVRFRGPSMDVGTAFEMGYMRGAGKPVFAYYDTIPFYGADEQAGLYAERTTKLYPLHPTDKSRDVHGQSIENFGMADNLMMIGALESGNTGISNTFKATVLKIAEHIQIQ